jgi:hypothetical protein
LKHSEVDLFFTCRYFGKRRFDDPAFVNSNEHAMPPLRQTFDRSYAQARSENTVGSAWNAATLYVA